MSSVVKQPNGHYKARYRDPNGRSRSITFERKFDAERFLEQTGTAKSKGDFIDPQRGRSLFSSWADRWWQTTIKLRPTTRKTYRQLLDAYVMPTFGDWQIASIDFMHVEDFIAAQLKAGQSPKQVKEMVSICSLIMKAAVLGRARNDNPAKDHTVPMQSRKIRQGDVFTMEQARQFVDNVRDPYKPAAWLLIFTGLRPSELCGLRVGSIDFHRNVVQVTETLTPVGGYASDSAGTSGEREPYRLVEGPPKAQASNRDIPIPEWLTKDVALMLAGRRERVGRAATSTDWLFESVAGGKPLNRDKFRKLVISPALKAAGLPPAFRTYDLRHTHASLLIALGGTPLEVAQRMGHADPTMVLRVYGHLFDGAQEALTAKLDTLHSMTMTAAAGRRDEVVRIDRKPHRSTGS